MRLLYPTLFLAWAALVLVPIVLYLFRPRPRTVPTSTLPFFKSLAREHQDSAWLRRLKYLLSLLLSVLAVLGGAAALGRLVVAPAAESVRTVVLVVDRSASMGAHHDKGPSRLDEAKALAAARLAGLPAGVGVVLVAYDRRPEVLLSRTTDERQVHRAVESLRVRPMEGDAQTALTLARRLAELETPAAIWHFSDGAKPEGATPGPDAAKVRMEHFSLALPQPVNVGITAFELRRLPLGQARQEAFVQVHSVGPRAVDADLEVRLDGALVSVRKLTIPPGRRETLLIPLDAAGDRDRVLSLRLRAPGDLLADDDVVEARIPRLRPLRALWIRRKSDPFTELALASLGVEGDLEVFQGEPRTWPPQAAADVLILDGWLPEEWPASGPMVVINPPRSLGPLRAVRFQREAVALDAVRATEPDHPVLYGVASDRVAISQTAVVEAGPLDTLWTGPHGPVLLAGDVRGQRIVVLPFSPQRSERLPLMASYPLLIGNAIYWAGEQQQETARGKNLRTGDLVELRGHLLWKPEDGTNGDDTAERAARFVELDRLGLWETDAGERGSASLLSPGETLLADAGDSEQQAAPARSVWLRGDLMPPLLIGLVLLLVVENWLYHRCLVY